MHFKNNFITTKQIAQAAESLIKNRNDNTYFAEINSIVREGDKPKVGYYSNYDEQLAHLDDKLIFLRNCKCLESTVVIQRSFNKIESLKKFLEANGFSTEMISNNQSNNKKIDCVKIGIMTDVRDLEFNNVFIIDLNDSVIPCQQPTNKTNQECQIANDRWLLYNCMMSARNRLFLFSSDKNHPTRFLKEINEELLNNITPPGEYSRSEHVDEIPF